MGSSPLVSTIVTFLDGEPFLEEAIESVFRQTYRSWELLLCDDGSTDGSTEIARAYAARWPDRIRYVEHEGHEHRGFCATRNLGLEHARGDLITWLDADDVWLPEKLERQVALLTAHPEAAMVFGCGEYWYSWTGKQSDAGRDFLAGVGVDTDTIVYPPAAAISFVRDDSHVPGDSAVLVHRRALVDIGGFDPALPDSHQDDFAWFRICLEHPVYVSSEIWFRYRQHENSYCARALREGTEQREWRLYLELLSEYLRERGGAVDEVSRAVQEEIERCRASWTAAREATRRGTLSMKRAWWWSTRSGRSALGRVLPQPARAWLGIRLKGREYVPPRGWVGFGGLRRTSPIDNRRGDARGTACDRYYAEQFIESHADDLRGRVLEIGSWRYARTFGDGAVADAHALYPDAGDLRSTLEANLAPHGAREASFDCVIVAEPLPTEAALEAAVSTAASALAPGGVLLAAVPGVAHTRPGSLEDGGAMTRFSVAAVRSLVERHFAAEDVSITGNGNVLAALALLHGIAAEELEPKELAHRDPGYELLVCVRAVKPR